MPVLRQKKGAVVFNDELTETILLDDEDEERASWPKRDPKKRDTGYLTKEQAALIAQQARHVSFSELEAADGDPCSPRSSRCSRRKPTGCATKDQLLAA